MKNPVQSRYIIGIDLGTTNSAVAYIDTQSVEPGKIRTFDIPQLTDEGNMKSLKTLPSFLYLPGEYELTEESISLPWDVEVSAITGEFARVQGARIPANLVSSAKSWLCHNRVDRTSGILPWGSEGVKRKISPVEASSFYLGHIRESWNYSIASKNSDSLMEEQLIVLTIPASFDETARELTLKAAKNAGFKELTLLEEPQAAFYSWLALHEEDRHEFIGPGEVVLVFDIGGGTTDFNLIVLKEREGGESFERVAVGDHIMLGGDNMDLALAGEVEKRFMGADKRVDYQQWLSLAHQCRNIKERLLSRDEESSASITILGKGRGVVGSSMKAELTKEEIEEIIINGFFGTVGIGDELTSEKKRGLQELGLPFVSDTLVMKHLSTFLKRHSVNDELNRAEDRGSGLFFVKPDVLLFNGGVFKSPAIRSKVSENLKRWFPDGDSLKILENDMLDHAVAKGAAYYGTVLKGEGVRISGGLGKAYFIAVQSFSTEKDAGRVSSDVKEIKAVCIIPRDMDTGEEISLTEPEFQVMTNMPVSFSVYSSSYRVGDRSGDIISSDKDAFFELPPIKTVLHFGKKSGSIKLNVSIRVRLNEYGTIDVWCESKKTTHRWKLEFQSRLEGEDSLGRSAPDEHTLDENTIEEAAGILDCAFKGSPGSDGDVTLDNLMKKLIEKLGIEKNEWPLIAVRALWDHLVTIKEAKNSTPRHEARWLNLSGFLLRPGFGTTLDDWRVRELWKLFPQGVKFSRDGQCRSEWWIMWRRAAGGLTEQHQDILFKKIAPWLIPSKKKKGVSKLSGAELTEIWMLSASLEHLPEETRRELGNELIKIIERPKGVNVKHYYWALSRIGARVPFYGNIENVVSREVVERWIGSLLEIKWINPRDSVYAITQMARLTGDRLRDLDESLRNMLIERFSLYEWAKPNINQLRDVVNLQWEDEKMVFGESLPIGLYI